jgi:hypothetical protein
MEFFQNLFQLPLAEQLSNLHGLLATLSLLVYGALFVAIPVYKKYQAGNLYKPLLYMLGIQTLLIGAVTTFGIIVYVAYRAAGGAREFLLSNAGTGWLHNIVFEYKEYLCAITPWLLLMVAFFTAARLGSQLYKNKSALKLILTLVIVSAIFVLLTATLAVLVTKMAPLEKFSAGADLFSKGGIIAIIVAILTLLVLGGIFWLINFILGHQIKEPKNTNPAAAMMYGSAAGLTVMWIFDWVQAASPAFKAAITYVPGIGQYSGVVLWGLIAVVVVTLAVWLITLGIKRPTPLIAAGWVLVTSALIQIIFLFPPFYHLFIK